MQNKHKIASLLHAYGEHYRQMVVLGTVLFVAGVMTTNIIQPSQAADTSSMNVEMTITTGTLVFDQMPGQFNFSSGTPGSIINGTTGSTNEQAIKTNDTRGTLDGYTISGYFNTNFVNGANQSDIASYMTWYANQISIVNVTGVDTELVAGPLATFAGVEANNAEVLALNGASGNKAAGAYNIHNLKMNYSVPLDTPAGVYTVEMVMTIV